MGDDGDDQAKGNPKGAPKAKKSANRRPSSTAASLDENKTGVRKSARGRVPKRRSLSPSPSTPPPQERKTTKKTVNRKDPPRKIGKAEPPIHVLMSRPKPREPSRPKSRAKTEPRKKKPRPAPPSPESDSQDFSDSDASSVLSDDPRLYASAGLYAPLVCARQKRYSDCTPVIPLPPRIIGGPGDQTGKVRVCNCKGKTHCLKLYCECFIGGLYCSSRCNCKECKNSMHFPRDRNIAIDTIVMRNPNAFRSRVPSNQSEKGCKCKKLSCLKKYCECFLVSAYCSHNCKCVECKNRVGDKKREKIMAKRLAARSSRQAASSSGRTTPDSVTIGRLCDSSLPISSRTLPMVMENGALFPAVSFGRAESGSASADSLVGTERSAIPTRYSPQSAASSRTSSPSRSDTIERETSLQKLWRVETNQVDQTFSNIERNLQDASSLEDRTVNGLSDRNKSMIEHRARMTMNNVMEDMRDLVAAVLGAETSAAGQFDNESEEEGQSAQVTDPESTPQKKRNYTEKEEKKSSGHGKVKELPVDKIECETSIELDASPPQVEEEITSVKDLIPLAGEAIRELTILANQEATLIHELAGVIRRKTAEMKEHRLRVVQEVKHKG